MRTLPELLNSWLPATDRPSILVVAEETAVFLTAIEKLEQIERPFEIVRVSSPTDGQRLVRRGAISLLIVDAANPLPGNLELLLEAVSKDRPPQILIASLQCTAKCTVRSVDRVDARMDSNAWVTLASDCAKRFQSGKLGELRAGELLEALADMPDEGWLRICSGDEFGDICVSHGRVVYCEVGRQSGDDAAAKLFEWKTCLFEFRMLPEFLRQNMDRPVGEIRKHPVAPTPPPKLPDFEEPDNFPVLEELLRTSPPAPSAPPEPVHEVGMEEPDDLPAFDPKVADADIVVEEPQDFFLRDQPDISDDLPLEEPSAMDFDALPPPQSAPPAPPAPEPPRIFDSVAVLCMNRMISCDPATDARHYDPETLSVFYERSKAYIMRHQLGEYPILQIGGGDSTIVVMAATGGDCLIAARTVGRTISGTQQQELERLAQLHGTPTPAFSR